MKKKAFVDFKELSAKELWDYNILEYESQNFISKYLYNNFYKNIKSVITRYVSPGNNLLEIGCGAAESSKRIYSFLNGCHFEASEFDNRYVSIIKQKKFPFLVTQESVYTLNRQNNEFDIIFLLEVLEHLEEPENAIKELFRVSNKYVVISVPNEPIWRIANMIRGKYLKNFGNTPGHINHFSSRTLKKLIAPFSADIKIYKPFPWLIAVAKTNW